VLHPDLDDNIDFVDSRSFVPYEPFLDDLDSHGSHVSGIVAAEDNDYGSIGVAPNATIVALKVLDGTGSGYFSWLLEALVYAAAIDVDVVNMSLGAYFNRSGYYCPDPADPSTWLYIGADEVAAFANLVKGAVNEVWKSGAFVTTSAGNDFLNGTGDAGLLHLPGDACEKGVNVAATGPLGWFFDPTTDLDVPAFYTNYGASIDLAAPGGNIDFALYPLGPWYFDMVFSTFAGGWGWMAGTSQASPHVAGVAALIIEANGGSLHPNQVEAILKRTADDLGAPGFDPFYGHGRINAAEAVK
jgi:subtilisin family serine protease